MPTNKRLFCSKPFKWFEVFQGKEIGDIYMCCPSWLNTVIGNLQHQSVEDIWNGEKAQKIRQSILDGSFSYCSKTLCPYLITESGPVQKIEDINEEELNLVIKGNLTVLPYGPRAINCSYDRSCNLSCPSCRTELIVETSNHEKILNTQKRIHNEALKDAHLLYITGSGDPFGSPYFRIWLQTMKLTDLPNLKEIFLHTNAQSWTERMWGTISKDIQPLIKSCEISIDAARYDTYAINRRGGDFKRLLKNLDFISSLRKSENLRTVRISMVVQENNFAEMPDFVKLGIKLGFDEVFFYQIINWGTYSAEDFLSRAVHLPSHARHEELRDVLSDDIFLDPITRLGNLSNLKRVPSENTFLDPLPLYQ